MKKETQNTIDHKIKLTYIKTFNEEPAETFKSPGRIELIGNHLDHQGGQTASLTIDRYIYGVSKKTEGDFITVINDGDKDLLAVSLAVDGVNEQNKGKSAAFVEGVVTYFKNNNYHVGGFNLSMASDLPSGAGLSSSAAYSLLFAKILSYYYNEDKVTPLELAKAAQYAESVHFGKPCGLLDQVTIAFGGLVFSDFKSAPPAITNYHENLPKLRFFVVDTGGSHENLTPHYEKIRTDMALVSKHYGKKLLSEVDVNAFQASLLQGTLEFEKRIINRATHYFTENHRVTLFKEAYQKADHAKLLALIKSSGESSAYVLNNLTYPGDLDQLLITHYEFLKDKYVTKVLGGGFAGALLVVTNEDVKLKDIIKHYSRKKIRAPRIYLMSPELSGTMLVSER